MISDCIDPLIYGWHFFKHTIENERDMFDKKVILKNTVLFSLLNTVVGFFFPIVNLPVIYRIKRCGGPYGPYKTNQPKFYSNQLVESKH